MSCFLHDAPQPVCMIIFYSPSSDRQIKHKDTYISLIIAQVTTIRSELRLKIWRLY